MASEDPDEGSLAGEAGSPTTRVKSSAARAQGGIDSHLHPSPAPLWLGVLSILSAVLGFLLLVIGFQSAFEWWAGEGLRGLILAFVVAPVCWFAGCAAGVVGWELAKGRGERGTAAVAGTFLNSIPASLAVLFWMSALLGSCGGGGSINRVEPAWSPDGKEIAFVNETESLFDQEIYVVNVENGEQRRLTDNQVPEFSPAWSPDGQRIAYVRATRFDVDFDQFDGYDVFVVNADGTREQNISRTPSSAEGSVEWSPDGQKMAFDSTGISVMSARGTGRRRVVGGYVGDGIAWSPDGTRIAFSREYAGLYVVDVDTRRLLRLTRLPSPNDDDYEPAWSPDGTRIAFVRLLDGEREEIYLMKADGGELRNLTQHSAGDASPAWSPDGTKIAFVSDRDGDQDIYVMSADGSGPTKLAG